MFEAIGKIIEKLKIKEIIGILFIACLIITFIPDNLAIKLDILKFRITYQTYLTLVIICTGSYYILFALKEISTFVLSKMINSKKIAINYMKKTMSPDEMGLLVEKFYDPVNIRFKTSSLIDIQDGRLAPLLNKKILYQSSQIGDFVYGFSFNLQPYVLEFLNENLRSGRITIEGTNFSYQLK